MKGNERFFIEQIKQGILSIDSQGRIWRHKKQTSRHNTYSTVEPVERAESELPKGYLYLRHGRTPFKKIAQASRIIWIYFKGDIDDSLEINHINGIKSDNRIENLELVTHLENVKHAFRTGLANSQGEHNTMAKLSDIQVEKIRLMWDDGLDRYEIADKFNISPNYVNEIVSYRKRK